MSGADKVILYDPPGAIGLVDPSAIFMIRFDELEDDDRPQDATRVCEDFDILVDDTNTMPPVDDAVLGRGRRFDGTATGVAAADIESGATLLTRDMSIQAVLSWDAIAQDSAGTPGTIIARGLGGSAPEYMAYGIQLDVDDVGSSRALFRWVWQDVSGAVQVQDGVLVNILPGQFTMLTATRRWISPTEVELRYYVGDQLLGIVTSAEGDIAGGTTGTMQLGYRRVTGTPNNFFAGILDEILVVDRELCLEEIEATWLRITKYQPLGVQLFVQLHDKGFPLADEPDSDAQLDTRMVGQALGYAAAQAENLRANFLPARAYGSTLEQWEEAVRVTPKPAQGIEERRARVQARLRQKRGASIPGIDDALQGLIGDAEVTDLEFLAFDQTIVEAFDTLELLRWDVTPVGSWTEVTDAARASPAAGTYTFAGGVLDPWLHARLSVGGNARQAHVLAKVAMTTPQAALEVGLYFGNAALGDYILLGLRDDAGTFKIVTETFTTHISAGVVVQATLGGNPANLWLHLYQTTVNGTWKAAWSTTSAIAGYTISANITHPTAAHWAGMYVRSTGATAGAAQVNVDDLIMRAPYGNRPFNAYVLLDEALGFTPDAAGAHSIVDALRHGYTHAAFITKRAVLCDDPDSGCDHGCMGGL